MNDNPPTRAQIASYRVLSQASGLGQMMQEALETILPMLPDALTDPQPVMPNNPGWYVDADGDPEYLQEGDRLTGVAPFIRLVPERAPVTREQLVTAITEGSPYGPTDDESKIVDRILSLVNGTRA